MGVDKTLGEDNMSLECSNMVVLGGSAASTDYVNSSRDPGILGRTLAEDLAAEPEAR